MSIFLLNAGLEGEALIPAAPSTPSSSWSGSSHGSQAERERDCCGSVCARAPAAGEDDSLLAAASDEAGDTGGLPDLPSCLILTRICRIRMVRSTAGFPVGAN